jgi:hypothetical protein
VSRNAAPSAELSLDLRRAIGFVWALALTAIALGILREIILPLIGTETVLQDLRHIAFDAEHSLPAWCESLLMAIAALLLFICSHVCSTDTGRFRIYWRALAVAFLLMSMDEAIAIHEVTMAPLRSAFGFHGLLYYAWVVPAAPILVAIAVLFIPFLRHLPPGVALRFAACGGLFVFGAFGLEFLGGYFFDTQGAESLAYTLEFIAEESAEIVAVTWFGDVLLRLIARQGALALRFSTLSREA